MPTNLYRKGDTNATPRWQEFLDDANRKELGNTKQNTTDHPLQGLMVNDGKIIFMLEPIIAKWPLVNLLKILLAIDKGTNQFKDGAKGHLFRTGKDLFGTLSENIHHYKGGKEKGCEVIRSDQWGCPSGRYSRL